MFVFYILQLQCLDLYSSFRFSAKSYLWDSGRMPNNNVIFPVFKLW